MDRAMAIWGGGAAITLAACARPSSCSAVPSRVKRDNEKLPGFVDIVVEVPKGSFVKRTPEGAVDFVAPLPSPFNYGSVPSVPAPDGKVKVKGVMRFMDAGFVDDKLICTQLIQGAQVGTGPDGTGNSSEPASQDLTMLDLLALTSFFNIYAVCKSGLNTMRGKAGRTAYEGWELFK